MEVEELMAVHGAMGVGVDPKEHLATTATDMVQALAQKKCPGDYPPGLNRYDLTSSILPISLAMAMYFTADVLSMYVPCLFQYCTLCDVQVLTVQLNFTNTSNKLTIHDSGCF